MRGKGNDNSKNSKILLRLSNLDFSGLIVLYTWNVGGFLIVVFKPKNYPPYWKQFSKYIRFERAKNVCEKCGIENYAVGFRTDKGFEYHGGNSYLDNVSHGFEGYKKSLEVFQYLKICYEDGWEKQKPTLVVLTVAHLDREPDGVCRCKKKYGFNCANPKHVLALCQRCHLDYDKKKHAKNRNKTIARKKDNERGLLELIEC